MADGNGYDAGRHSRPVVRAVAAAAILGLGLVLAAMVAGSRTLAWTTWRDDRLDVTGRYPSSWHRQSFDEEGLATNTGTVFSNVAHHFEHPELPAGSGTTAWDYRELPDDAVVVEVARTIRFDFDCERTTFPVSLSDARVSEDRPSYGAPPRLSIPVCITGRNGLGVHVLFFPDAPARDVSAAREFVRSIRPL